MTNPSKAKGDRAERELVAWLQQRGFSGAHRSRAGWSADVGDVLGVPDLTVEVKSAKTMRLGPWLDELDQEIINGETASGVLVVKRPGWSDPGQWFAVQRNKDFWRERRQTVSARVVG